MCQTPQDDDLKDIINSVSTNQTAKDFVGALKTRAFLKELMNVNSDADNVPDLIEILLGTDPSDADSKPESLIYQHELKDGSKLKAQTI